MIRPDCVALNNLYCISYRNINKHHKIFYQFQWCFIRCGTSDIVTRRWHIHCIWQTGGHSPNAVSMLAHRLRRWPNIETALNECPCLLGTYLRTWPSRCPPRRTRCRSTPSICWTRSWWGARCSPCTWTRSLNTSLYYRSSHWILSAGTETCRCPPLVPGTPACTPAGRSTCSPRPARTSPPARSGTGYPPAWSCHSFQMLKVNTKHLYNICTTWDQRRRRWADLVQMVYKYFVFAGVSRCNILI